MEGPHSEEQGLQDLYFGQSTPPHPSRWPQAFCTVRASRLAPSPSRSLPSRDTLTMAHAAGPSDLPQARRSSVNIACLSPEPQAYQLEKNAPPATIAISHGKTYNEVGCRAQVTEQGIYMMCCLDGFHPTHLRQMLSSWADTTFTTNRY